MVELLSVIVILAILMALLLPAINAAMKSAKNAAVGAEINSMASALAAFKAKYGIYPPSRVYLAENGYFPVTSTAGVNGNGDISIGTLAQRTVTTLRTMFPRVTLSTSTPVFVGNPPAVWYDFNGNGVFDGSYILQGHECLVFFLGGIPSPPGAGSLASTGFGKDPTNPFVNSLVSQNRTQPMFEFDPGRLFLDPHAVSLYGANMTWNSPGYLDSMGNATPTGLAGTPTNFYAYFASYGNAGYDPNDVNFYTEQDNSGNMPELGYHVGFPILPLPGPNPAVSPAPNPYTSTTTAPYTGTTFVMPTYLNPQTFQIISSGSDGFYGVGGQYAPNNTAESLPLDTTSSVYVNTSDHGVRLPERDNMTNFHTSKLE